METELIKIVVSIIVAAIVTIFCTACGAQMGTNSYWEKQDRLIREVLKAQESQNYDKVRTRL